MEVYQKKIIVPDFQKDNELLENLKKAVLSDCGQKADPIRVIIVGKGQQGYICEIEAIRRPTENRGSLLQSSVFDFRHRLCERTSAFNVVMLIPTGIDCIIGGHAGDATPSSRLLASQCDQLIMHPNVVNASDINEQESNCLYVEGSLICRLMMGTIGLQKVRKNRVILVTEERPDAPFVVENTINCANGARATLGMDIQDVVVLEEGISMKACITDSGRISGSIDGMHTLVKSLQRRQGTYDAIALASRITPFKDTVELHRDYFTHNKPNPWGGVEAVLTHTTSTVFDLPSAHAPTMSNKALFNENWGIVDPRKAAESISTTYLFCILKGLHKAPKVVTGVTGNYDPSMITAEDISALVIPDGCIGLPTLAALEQGIPVIAVRNNTNLMRNNLSELPFRSGQLIYAENYYEAAGILAALRNGISPASLGRPISSIHIDVEAKNKKSKSQPQISTDKMPSHELHL